MAVPKRRRSKSKKRSHKANWKISVPHVRPCPNCGHLAQSHVVCINCGFYKDKIVINKKVRSKDKEI